MVPFLIGLVVFFGILAIYVEMQPSIFRVARSTTIDASPQIIFDQLNEFHNWQAWSPWAELDPNAKNTLDGPSSGVGAKMSWEGNRKVGKGSSTITESRPGELVKIRLDFLKPMKATNTSEFTLTPKGSQTEVNWTMEGPANFIGKAFGLFLDCEKMVGGQFEKGLAKLQAVAEAKK